MNVDSGDAVGLLESTKNIIYVSSLQSSVPDNVRLTYLQIIHVIIRFINVLLTCITADLILIIINNIITFRAAGYSCY